jgi:gamma-glutamyl-gamma-aminobutyrate hydrolase PuuD
MLHPRKEPVVLTTAPADTWKVNLVKDTVIEPVDLYFDVYVAGDRHEQAAFANMLVRAKCTKVDTPEEADLVIFTGGEDVNPLLYNQSRHATTLFDSARDLEDAALFDMCLRDGIPMFGVCRGAQFLWVMHGGSLYQDINNHNGAHTMYDVIDNRMLGSVSSVHHQSVKWDDNLGADLVAWSRGSTKRFTDAHNFESGEIKDVEAYFFTDTACFGVQGHPEYKGYNAFTAWTLNKLNDFIVEHPDIILEKKDGKGRGVRRLKSFIRDKSIEKLATEETT